MIRADLEVDLFDSWWRRRRRRKRVKWLMRSQQENFDDMKELHIQLAAEEIRQAREGISDQEGMA
jgi:hypothetical protein